ncbi:hypothetical protein [Terriglobus sp. RCC_193]|uniref:hypothetical protein n=1 Tax=Terriglobus sp. RCC_193 TaxID=3239218 RepID=UPI00352340EA
MMSQQERLQTIIESADRAKSLATLSKMLMDANRHDEAHSHLQALSQTGSYIEQLADVAITQLPEEVAA